jgi:hypothetical protein
VVVPIVLVVVLAPVIENAEYVVKIRSGVEDEYKDEYESPVRCEIRVARCLLRVAGPSIAD